MGFYYSSRNVKKAMQYYNSIFFFSTSKINHQFHNTYIDQSSRELTRMTSRMQVKNLKRSINSLELFEARFSQTILNDARESSCY